MTAETRFTLHPRLAADCHVLADGPLSRLLMLNDRRYYWCVLVPRVVDVTELHRLDDDQAARFWAESRQLAGAMEAAWGGDKFNLGALGNIVEQLHVHHILRFHDDPAWPGPVWGHSPAEPIADDELAARIEQLRAQRLAGFQWF